MLQAGKGRPQPQIPLVVVGGLRSGGSGKTGVTAELARRFSALGLRVAVLAYRLGPGPAGKREPDLIEVGEDSDWRTSSEEAVLLRRLTGARVFATRDRARAWRALAAVGERSGSPFDLLLSDDGFQDLRLTGAFRILLSAPGERPGLWDLLPSGPYRETWRARERADLILEGPLPAPVSTRADNLPVLEITQVTHGFFRRLILPDGAGDGRPWMVLCGLGNNRRFVADLEARGIRPLAVLEAPDHRTVDRRRIEALSRRHPGVGFLCTRKDYIKVDAEAADRYGIRAVDEEITLGDAAFHAAARHAGIRLPEPLRRT